MLAQSMVHVYSMASNVGATTTQTSSSCIHPAACNHRMLQWWQASQHWQPSHLWHPCSASFIPIPVKQQAKQHKMQMAYLNYMRTSNRCNITRSALRVPLLWHSSYYTAPMLCTQDVDGPLTLRLQLPPRFRITAVVWGRTVALPCNAMSPNAAHDCAQPWWARVAVEGTHKLPAPRRRQCCTTLPACTAPPPVALQP